MARYKCRLLTYLLKTLGADITVKIIRILCNFKKMDKIYMLILVSRDL